MIRRNRAQSSSLFLLELILAILFFSIASAVCVQFFVQSHILSRRAQTLDLSVNQVCAAAELITTSNSETQAAQRIYSSFPQTVQKKEYLEIGFDEEFLPCEPAHAVYTMIVSLQTENQMLSGSIAMLDKTSPDPIYELSVDHHLMRRVPHEP